MTGCADMPAALSPVWRSSRLLLVCDVGGGTTDLTLIKIEYGPGEPKLTRIGVGDHLMLGGDNIDLALAHLAESRLRERREKTVHGRFVAIAGTMPDSQGTFAGRRCPGTSRRDFVRRRFAD